MNFPAFILPLFRVLVLAAIGVLSHAASPVSPVRQLSDLLANYQRLSFDFHQKHSDKQGNLLEEVFGVAQLARPHWVRWEILVPYPQLIVGNGDVVWFYDADLLQATRRPFEHDLQETPALVLLGSHQELSENFEVGLGQTEAGWQSFVLTPLTTTTYFRVIELLFEMDLLRQFIIKDHLNQVTVFELDQLRVNPDIAAETFSFTPPEGVDIYDETENFSKSP